MDGARFDALSRWLGRRTSRRQLFGPFVGVIGAGLAGGHPAAAFICRQGGVLCGTDAQCCSGNCIDNHCACPSGQLLCNDRTCAECCAETDCDGDQSCCGGTCVTCPDGGVCTGASCGCPAGESACEDTCLPMRICPAGASPCAAGMIFSCGPCNQCTCGTALDGSGLCFATASFVCQSCAGDGDCASLGPGAACLTVDACCPGVGTACVARC